MSQRRPDPIPPEEDLRAEYRKVFEQRLAESQGADTRARKLVGELVRRESEALNLYRPLPQQERFHACKAPERLLRGSNRAGKTLTASVEVARALLGRDPYGKYPLENGRCFAVGKDGKHLGAVMYRKLFRAGAFWMIRDLETGLWRSYDPSKDGHRQQARKPAPPLIPQRYIASISWEKKASEVPEIVRLINGWELNFFSSLGKPPQGSDVDLVFFDEEIIDQTWYGEMAARLIDRAGRFFWAATPQAATEQLFDLHQRCQEPKNHNKAVEIVLLMDDNPYIPEAQKREFISKLSDEERRVRVFGEFAFTGYKVFPEYTDLIHGCDHFAVPPSWTRYMVVDPGHQVCAVLFAAVPPDNHHVYVYDELYLLECNAARFGEAVAARAQGQDFEGFIIDGHMGRHTQVGSGQTVEQAYSDALRHNKVRSRRTGHGFVWGSDDIVGGIEAIKGWLRIRPDGTTKLRIFRDACKNLDSELKRYHYTRVDGRPSDKPHQRGAVHTVDDLRYLALFDPRWVANKPGSYRGEGAFLAFKAKQKKNQSGALALVPLGQKRA